MVGNSTDLIPLLLVIVLVDAGCPKVVFPCVAGAGGEGWFPPRGGEIFRMFSNDVTRVYQLQLFHW